MKHTINPEFHYATPEEPDVPHYIQIAGAQIMRLKIERQNERLNNGQPPSVGKQRNYELFEKLCRIERLNLMLIMNPDSPSG